MQTIQNVLLGLLVLFLIWKGIYPALTNIDSDFPNYYTSSRIVLDKKETSNIYDDNWFQQQIYAYGIPQQGKFSPFPPLTAFIMLPFASAPPLTALRLWTILNVAILFFAIVLLSKITNKSRRWSGLLFLSSGLSLANNFRLGQFYLVVVLLTMAGYFAWQRSNAFSSGLYFGIGAAMKYFPLIYLPLLIIRKEWKPVFSCLFAIGVLYALSFLILGSEIHKKFLSMILFEHITGNIQNPFSSTFQSWNSLLRRMFVFDSEWNNAPLMNAPIIFILLTSAIIITTVIIMVYACVRAGQNFGNKAFQLQFAIVTIGALLLLPAGATYHFLLLVLPIALIMGFGIDLVIEHKILLALYVAMGFIPYSLFRFFDGKGFLTLLAYPRLWIMTAIFLVTLRFVVRYRFDHTDQLLKLLSVPEVSQ